VGIDLVLEDTTGEEIAGKLQLMAEYYYPATKCYGTSHKAPMVPAYLNK